MISGNIYLLEQGASLLGQLDDQVYAAVPAEISRSGIGAHLRHCLDFYDSFLRGIELGKVDYDLRERNELIEVSRFAALAKIRELVDRLRQVCIGRDLELLVKRENEHSFLSLAWDRSSIQRELQFLFSHTVHHYALINVFLRLQGIQPVADFGVAPSTLKFWQSNA